MGVFIRPATRAHAASPAHGGRVGWISEQSAVALRADAARRADSASFDPPIGRSRQRRSPNPAARPRDTRVPLEPQPDREQAGAVPAADSSGALYSDSRGAAVARRAYHAPRVSRHVVVLLDREHGSPSDRDAQLFEIRS